MPVPQVLPDSPEALPAPRKLSDVELCTMYVVPASTMRHVLTQYKSAHGTTIACDLASLARLLKRAMDQVQTNRDLLNQYKSIASGQSRANGSAKSRPVPKKARFAAQGDNKPGEVSRSDVKKKKECDRCAKWKPEVKNTHWTKDCKASGATKSITSKS